MERGRYLKELRPEIKTAELNENMTEIEQFQNSVLRPILKFQNELLSVHFSQFAKAYQKNWDTLSNEKKTLFIESSLMKNQGLRKTIIGFVIGLISLKEYENYLLNKSELNKRIIQMSKERILSNLSFL